MSRFEMPIEGRSAERLFAQGTFLPLLKHILVLLQQVPGEEASFPVNEVSIIRICDDRRRRTLS